MKVLVADDSQLIRKVITANLINLGVSKENIVEAVDGEMAYRNLHRIKDLEIVITDLAMPKIDGYKLTALIREDEKYKHVSIVVISGSLDDDIRIKLKELDVSCFLEKPFNKDKFMEMMNPIIQQAMSGKQNKAQQDANENKRCILDALGRSVKEARVEKYDLVLEFEESEIHIDLDEFLKLAKYKPKTISIQSKEQKEILQKRAS